MLLSNVIPSFPANAELPDEQWPGVFVFGANAQGIHGAGAAKHAHDILGYPNGMHDQLYKDAYGLSTKQTWRHNGSLDVIASWLPLLHRCIEHNQSMTFNITAVGTGYAGLSFDEVAPILLPLVQCVNVRWDARWLPHLNRLLSIR